MRLRVVTSNEGKFRELKSGLEGAGHIAEWSRISYPEIQASSLDEVVEESLRWIVRRLVPIEPIVLEDSGLFIEALSGFPGVYSAYVFKTLGWAGVLKLMEGVEKRAAAFESRIGFWAPGRGPHIFKGSCRGYIALEPRGSSGFGYDPIFAPEGEERTFAEMSVGEKNALSHRGRALAELIEYLRR
ncbi:MAG: XTP/dITP diphosphatase [Thermoplasmatota archaeon]